MSRSVTRFTIFVIVLPLFFACSDDEIISEPGEQQKEKTESRISKIEITEFGKTTSLVMSYETNAVNIEFQPYKGNVESRIELNKKQQIREIISGTQRIQYLYDENGNQIGIFSGNGMQQIMFDYSEGKLSAQHTIVGNDTIVSYLYHYENGLPNEVEVRGRNAENRVYRLEYSDVDNSLSGFNEMVLPSEFSLILGIPAMYGKKYLKKASRIDEGTLVKEPLSEGYTPKLETIEFEITRSGKQENLKLVSDGSRQWNAVIYW